MSDASAPRGGFSSADQGHLVAAAALDPIRVHTSQHETGDVVLSPSTSHRTGWYGLPTAVRHMISDGLDRLQVGEHRLATSGYTTSFAATFKGDDGHVFVRAVPETDTGVFAKITRESRVLTWLGADVPAPSIKFAMTAVISSCRWHVVATEQLPTTRFGAATNHHDLAALSETLTDMSARVSGRHLDPVGRRLQLEAPHRPNQAPWYFAIASGDTRAPLGFPAWLKDRSRELANLAMEATQVINWDSLSHSGIRPNRTAFTPDGVRITGWSDVSLAPKWADWVTALTWARAEDAPVDFWLGASELTAHVPPRHIDAFLAAAAAHHAQQLDLLPQAGYEASVAWLHHDAAVTALSWIAERRNWA